MTLTFAIIAFLTLGSAIAAMTLRTLVHCALALTVTFAGLAALYLQLDAQFVGFAQILVYVGAVAILIVFAILLTRGSEPPSVKSIFSSSWAVGVAISLVVFGILARVILSSPAVNHATRAGAVAPIPSATVSQIGGQLMTKYILPLEVVGLLLTAALIGAVIIAMHEKEQE
jgi:NADH-quinone oxidoreductase subunit J